MKKLMKSLALLIFLAATVLSQTPAEAVDTCTGTASTYGECYDLADCDYQLCIKGGGFGGGQQCGQYRMAAIRDCYDHFID